MTSTHEIAIAVDSKLSEPDEMGGSVAIEADFSGPAGESVSRVYTFRMEGVLEARFVVDWAAYAHTLTAEDIGRVTRVAAAANVRAFDEDRPAILLLAGTDPDESVAQEAFDRHARILIARPIPATLSHESSPHGAAFGRTRTSVSQVRIAVEDPTLLSAWHRDQLDLILNGETKARRFRGTTSDSLVSLDALETTLPRDAHDHQSHAFPMRGVVLADGSELPIREVVFTYRVEWRPLRGNTHAHALAAFVSAWVFG